MNYLLITYFTVVSSFQQFYRQINDRSRDIRDTGTADSKRPSWENHCQEYSVLKLSSLIDNMMQKNSSEAKNSVERVRKSVNQHHPTPPNDTNSQTEQNSAGQFGKFRRGMFSRFTLLYY